jgi:hypothetical protein
LSVPFSQTWQGCRHRRFERHPLHLSRLLQRRARVITDRLELQADQTVERYRRIAASSTNVLANLSIERYRRIAASSTNVLVNPVTGLPRRLVELPMEVHSAIEAVAETASRNPTFGFWMAIDPVLRLRRTPAGQTAPPATPRRADSRSNSTRRQAGP